MMDESITYIQVIAPVKLDWEPWYIAPWKAKIGQRVEVRLRNAKYVGVITKVSDVRPLGKDVKMISAVRIEGLRDISDKELEFWRFLSGYYMCTLGEIYKLAYPLMLTNTEQTGAAILARLEKRLAKKDEELKKKHCQRVYERLESERENILKEIKYSRSHPDCEATSDEKKQNPGKPVLLFGQERLHAYIDRIDRTLTQGQNVLILEPDYDFTSAIQEDLKHYYKDKIMSYNSRITPKKRRECLDTVTQNREPYIIIGTRQAIFLPYRDIGLIIVDQEQDMSYKQSDNFPRINFRDAAAALARIHKSKLVLGSNAPSLETVFNCKTDKYLISMMEDGQNSDVILVDIPKEKAKNGMVGLFSRTAIAAMQENKDRIITIIRGYEKPEDVYSAAQKFIPGTDPQILHSLSARKSLVRSDLMIILQADSLFSRTDFRADEKAFALLSALKSRCKTMIIQTGNSQHPVFQAILQGRTKELYKKLLYERKNFNLPPYTRLLDIITRDGTLVRREVLSKDNHLSENKEKIYSCYSKGFAFDVDPS